MGDGTYLLRLWMQIAVDRIAFNETKKEFNTDMSAMQVTVKWSYKELKKMWGINDYARLLKAFQAPIGLIYTESALLTN